MRKPIREYCRIDLPGWQEFPYPVVGSPGDVPYTVNMLDGKGFQLIASVVDSQFEYIHVTLAIMSTLRPDLTKEQLFYELNLAADSILESFFGDRQFNRAPPDFGVPHVIHYFSPIKHED